jgi:hypothetical protein
LGQSGEHIQPQMIISCITVSLRYHGCCSCCVHDTASPALHRSALQSTMILCSALFTMIVHSHPHPACTAFMMAACCPRIDMGVRVCCSCLVVPPPAAWTSAPGERLTTSKQDHMVKTISIQVRGCCAGGGQRCTVWEEGRAAGVTRGESGRSEGKGVMVLS